MAGENLQEMISDASKPIKGLIEDSLAKVKHGTDLVDLSGQTLNGIMGSVQRVGQIVSQMTEATDEQTNDIAQVNIAMTQMNDVTNVNTRETEAVAATARSLFEDAVRCWISLPQWTRYRSAADYAADGFSPTGTSPKNSVDRSFWRRELRFVQ